MIKMVMAMRHGVLPRTLHVDGPTTHVDWSAGAVRLLTEQQAWPEYDRPRRAGVSSFGISGTNAHVVLEESPDAEVLASGPRDGTADRELDAPWLLSAVDETAVRAQARRLREHLQEREEIDPVAVGATLATARPSSGCGPRLSARVPPSAPRRWPR